MNSKTEVDAGLVNRTEGGKTRQSPRLGIINPLERMQQLFDQDEKRASEIIPKIESAEDEVPQTGFDIPEDYADRTDKPK